MSLSKLRKHYNDALFVRTPEGMAPTPHAEEIIPNIREAINLLNQTLSHKAAFDPAQSNRLFRLAMTDVGVRVVLPLLLPLLAQTAPHIRLQLTNLSDDTPGLMETGAIDLAIGLLPEPGPGFFQQLLLMDKYVCLVCANHPRIIDKLTLEQFQSERHVVVSFQGTVHSIIDRTLEKLNISRPIGIAIPNFLAVPSTIKNTNFLATVPGQFAASLRLSGGYRVLELPFQMPPLKIMQHWHERFAKDPAIRWVRGVLAGLYQSLKGSE